MASTLDPKQAVQAALEEAVVVVDADELDEARRDPRVEAFHAEADALLAELEREGANF